MWHGSVPKEKSDQYYKYLLNKGIKDYCKVCGNRGIYLLRREEKDISHFYTLTIWNDIEAIKEFAGCDYEKAKYYPEDSLYLTEMEPNVSHFEILEISPAKDLIDQQEQFRYELFHRKPILFYK